MNLRALLPFAAAGVLLVAALPATAATHIERVTSPGGVEAWLVEDHTNPIIAMNASFPGGASQDPAGKAGLANLVSDLLDEGAGDLDSQAYQGKLADLAIELSFDAGRDSFDVGLKTLADNRDTAFSMLGLALTKPRFDADAVERVRGQVLTELTQQLESPGSVANRALAEIAPLLDAAFAGVPATADLAAVPDVQLAGGGTVKVIRRPIPQSVAIFAEAGIKRDDPDWYAAFVMNHILGGGGFSSRLMNEVREKRGLAYETSSFLIPHDHAALIGGEVGTRNDRMAESLDIVRHEWNRMAESGVTEAELADAKKFLNGSFPLELGSTAGIAGLLQSIQRYHLGIDYLDRRAGLIDAVTQADIRRVAKRLLHADALAAVVVGDPKGMN
jgi:zinc protease